MSNKICPNCGTVVDGLQGLCPNCGFEFPVTSKAKLTAEHSSFQEDDGAFDTEYYQNQNSSRYKPRVFVAIFICIIAVVVLWNYDSIGFGQMTKEMTLDKFVDACNNDDVEKLVDCLPFEQMGVDKESIVSYTKSNYTGTSGHYVKVNNNSWRELSKDEIKYVNSSLRSNNNMTSKLTEAYVVSLYVDSTTLNVTVGKFGGIKWYVILEEFGGM